MLARLFAKKCVSMKLPIRPQACLFSRQLRDSATSKKNGYEGTQQQPIISREDVSPTLPTPTRVERDGREVEPLLNEVEKALQDPQLERELRDAANSFSPSAMSRIFHN